MRQLASEQSRGIFRQLADLPGPTGVKTVIENHDAWLHNNEAQDEVTVALRQAAESRPKSPQVARRIMAQRQALNGMVVHLPHALSSAI